MGYYYSPWILTASWPPSEHTGVLSPSSRPLRVGREGVAANCALRTGQGPRRTTHLLPSFKLTQLTSVASRRSFPQGQLSSVSLATLVDAAVRHSGGGEDRGALHRPICAVRTAAPEVGRWSVSAIPAAMTVSTTWGTKICRPRGRQPGPWRQRFLSPGCQKQSCLLLVPVLGRHARPKSRGLTDGEPSSRSLPLDKCLIGASRCFWKTGRKVQTQALTKTPRTRRNFFSSPTGGRSDIGTTDQTSAMSPCLLAGEPRSPAPGPPGPGLRRGVDGVDGRVLQAPCPAHVHWDMGDSCRPARHPLSTGQPIGSWSLWAPLLEDCNFNNNTIWRCAARNAPTRN